MVACSIGILSIASIGRGREDWVNWHVAIWKVGICNGIWKVGICNGIGSGHGSMDEK